MNHVHPCSRILTNCSNPEMIITPLTQGFFRIATRPPYQSRNRIFHSCCATKKLRDGKREICTWQQRPKYWTPKTTPKTKDLTSWMDIWMDVGQFSRNLLWFRWDGRCENHEFLQKSLGANFFFRLRQAGLGTCQRSRSQETWATRLYEFTSTNQNLPFSKGKNTRFRWGAFLCHGVLKKKKSPQKNPSRFFWGNFYGKKTPWVLVTRLDLTPTSKVQTSPGHWKSKNTMRAWHQPWSQSSAALPDMDLCLSINDPIDTYGNIGNLSDLMKLIEVVSGATFLQCHLGGWQPVPSALNRSTRCLSSWNSLMLVES